MVDRKNPALLLGFLLLVVLLLFAAGCQAANRAAKDNGAQDIAVEPLNKPIELRFTTVVTTLHPDFKSWEKFSAEVDKRTNGQVKITMYPSGTLTPPLETFNAVKSGIADIGAAPVGYSAAVMPLNKLFGDAMMGASNAKEAIAVWNTAWDNMPELRQELDGVHVLWRYATVPLSVGTTKTEIRKLEDLKGLVMRIPPGLEPLAKAWGVSPVSMPVGDIYVAMEKGAVDGFYGGSEMLQSMRLAEFAKYVTNVQTAYGLGFVGMNQKVWDSLPEDVQAVFNDLGEWGQTITIEAFDEAEKQAREFALSQGCEFIEIEEAELQRIFAASRPAFQEIAAGLEKQGKPAQKVLSELEKLIAQN